jgi:hypothetical protein
MQEIAGWLDKLGMSEYAQRFAENRIDFSVLPDLSDQDLEKMGVVLGDRRKILRAIAALTSAVAAEQRTTAAGYGTPSGTYRPQNSSYVDRASQRSGINQDPDHSLCHADQSQQDKLRVVEDTEVSDTGCPKSKK